MRIFVNDYLNLNNELLINLEENNYIIKEEENIKHILLVMKKKIGSLIEVVDLNNQVFIAKIIEIKPLTVNVIEKIDNPESKIYIDLYQGLPKFDKMDHIIEKAVELGINKICSVQMDRSIVRLDEKTSLKKLERWTKISESAAKQSKRNIIPKVEYLKSIQNIDFKKYDLNIFLDTEISKNNFKLNILKRGDVKTISVIVGPEGGFSEKEKEYLLKTASSVNLGSRIFRTETASVVILSLLQYILGDF